MLFHHRIIFLTTGILCLLSPLTAGYMVGISSESAPTNRPLHFATGASVTLLVHPNSSADSLPPEASYQWYHDGVPVEGGIFTELQIASLTADNVGNYRIEVRTEHRSEYSTNTQVINVYPPLPAIVDHSFSAQVGDIDSLPFFRSDGRILLHRYPAGDGTRQMIELGEDGRYLRTTILPESAGRPLVVLADNSYLTPFAPYRVGVNGTVLPLILPVGFDPDQPIDEAEAASDGTAYLRQGNVIARMLHDGSIDPNFSFDPPKQYSLDDSDFTASAIVESMIIDPSNRILVNLRYPNDYGFGYMYGYDHVLRLLPSGSIDPTFSRFRTTFLYSRLYVTPLPEGGYVVFENYHGTSRLWVSSSDGALEVEAESSHLPISPPVVDPSNSHIYFNPGATEFIRYRITASAVEQDENFYSGFQRSYTYGRVTAPGDGLLYVGGNFETWEGHPTRNLARLRTDVSPTDGAPPYATIGGDIGNIPRGENISINSSVTGTGPFSFQWLALDGQPLPEDSTSPILELPDFQIENMGRYQLRAAGAEGITLSNVVRAAGDRSQVGLANLSGRAIPGEGEHTMIAGFSVERSSAGTPDFFMLRGVGPTLLDYGVAAPLLDPKLQVFSRDGEEVAASDNWWEDPNGYQIPERSVQFGAFPLREQGLDAALQVGFHESDQLTVHLNKNPADHGIALLEIYEIADFQDSQRPPHLRNISLRAHTSPGDGTVIAGFVISDPLGYSRTLQLLLRVVGPSLSSHGVQDALADPVLTLRNSEGTVVSIDDNWGESPDASTTTAVTNEVGAFALNPNSLDAAILVELAPGAYTLAASGKNESSGIVVIEIYLVP